MDGLLQLKCSALTLGLLVLATGTLQGVTGEPLTWSQLAELPDSAGTAGAFIAVIDDRLVVAGGSRKSAPLPQDGEAVVLDHAWVLETPSGTWRPTTPLPQPLAFGGAASFGDYAVFAGGTDGNNHHNSVWRIRFEGEDLVYEPLPALTQPCAYATAAILNNVLYLAGGQNAPSSTNALNSLVTFDPSEPIPVWKTAGSWSGPERILASLVAQDGALYLLGGAALSTNTGSNPILHSLSDSHRYHPDQGWTRIADFPHQAFGAVAAPLGPSHVLVLGGDSSSTAGIDTSPGPTPLSFSSTVHSYHTITDTWVELEQIPSGLGMTSAVSWQETLTIPGGASNSGLSVATVLSGILSATESSFAMLDYAILISYFSVLVMMGLYYAGKRSSTDEFFLAGQRMPWWATGLSIFGTQLSSISFMAIPAKIYSTDWVYFLIQMSIVLVAFPVVFFYLPHFRRVKMMSAYEYLESRFNLQVRLYASLSFILYQLGRMAIVLFLPAIALSTVTGISVYTCILVMGLLATLYTVMGGITVVIWTDVVQVFVLYGGALLSLIILVMKTEGGLTGILSTGMEYDKFHMFNWTWDWTTTAVWVVLVGNLFLNLVPYTSDQAVVQRYFTTKDEKAAARSIWTNAILIIPSTLTLFLLGTGLWAFYRANPELLNPALPTDSIFPLFISQQLPAGVAGLLIAALFAASMSTLDSSLNSVSAAVVTDFYVHFRPASSDASRLWLARIITAGLGIIATATSIALATFEIGSLWDAFQGMMGLLGGGLAGLFGLGIFFRSANSRGAITGALTSVVVLFWVQQNTNLHFFLYGMVGILTCVGVGLLVSLLSNSDTHSPELS